MLYNIYSFAVSFCVTNDTAVIWFVVRVPVLSVQMTDVHPSVSTDGSFRTITFFSAILLVPKLRHRVTEVKSIVSI